MNSKSDQETKKEKSGKPDKTQMDFRRVTSNVSMCALLFFGDGQYPHPEILCSTLEPLPDELGTKGSEVVLAHSEEAVDHALRVIGPPASFRLDAVSKLRS